MKKSLRNVLCLLALVAITAPSFAGIEGTKHDFKGATWNTATEICNVCHAPHKAAQKDLGPLWNHEPTVATFTTYQSPTMEQGASALPQPSADSKLCLSCHDGTISLADFGGTTGTTGDKITGAGLLGTDLGGTHPISFTYDESDTGLFAKSTTVTGIGTIADMLAGGTTVECSSCHDVHGGVASTPLLVIDNTNSDLCLTCHDK